MDVLNATLPWLGLLENIEGSIQALGGKMVPTRVWGLMKKKMLQGGLGVPGRI